MSDNKIQMFNMLQDVITHFSENPVELRSDDSYICLYNPPKNKPKSIGCAIGMYLPVKTAKILDKCKNSGIRRIMEDVPEYLPEWMKNMDENFLSELQNLHDDDSNWDDDNISQDGVDKVLDMCYNYGFDYNKLKFKK